MKDAEINALKSEISNLELPEEKKRDLLAKADNLRPPLDTDVWIYRLVVLFLGVTILSTVIGGLMLTYKGAGAEAYKVPDGLIAIGSAAVGALAGLLAPSPKA